MGKKAFLFIILAIFLLVIPFVFAEQIINFTDFTRYIPGLKGKLDTQNFFIDSACFMVALCMNSLPARCRKYACCALFQNFSSIDIALSFPAFGETYRNVNEEHGGILKCVPEITNGIENLNSPPIILTETNRKPSFSACIHANGAHCRLLICTSSNARLLNNSTLISPMQ